MASLLEISMPALPAPQQPTLRRNTTFELDALERGDADEAREAIAAQQARSPLRVALDAVENFAEGALSIEDRVSRWLHAEMQLPLPQHQAPVKASRQQW